MTSYKNREILDDVLVRIRADALPSASNEMLAEFETYIDCGEPDIAVVTVLDWFAKDKILLNNDLWSHLRRWSQVQSRRGYIESFNRAERVIAH
jgi:hypothetical protein